VSERCLCDWGVWNIPIGCLTPYFPTIQGFLQELCVENGERIIDTPNTKDPGSQLQNLPEHGAHSHPPSSQSHFNIVFEASGISEGGR